jgi:hypothetical protein
VEDQSIDVRIVLFCILKELNVTRSGNQWRVSCAQCVGLNVTRSGNQWRVSWHSA